MKIVLVLKKSNNSIRFISYILLINNFLFLFVSVKPIFVDVALVINMLALSAVSIAIVGAFNFLPYLTGYKHAEFI